MPERLTQSIVDKSTAREKRYSIRDSVVSGLLLRVEPSGKKNWLLDYRSPASGNRNTKKIGTAGVLTVAQAREKAKNILAQIELGEDVLVKRKKALTLGEIVKDYAIKKTHGTNNALDFLQRDFSFLLNRRMDLITVEEIEDWRRERLEEGVKAASINRAVGALKACFRWAMENNYIEQSKVIIHGRLKHLPETDSRETIRFLRDDERKRLLEALEKQKEPYLKPAVLLSLNTGIRRGALFSLTWKDVDFEDRIIYLSSKYSKNKKKNYVPMNDIVFEALSEWKKFHETTEWCKKWPWVFPSPKSTDKEEGKEKPAKNSEDVQEANENKKPERIRSENARKSQPGQMHDMRSSWEKLLTMAEISDFRWHDMRHDFASQLVKAEVSLVAVKELLSHSNWEITLNYAHIDPQYKVEAVKRLDRLYR